VAAGALDGAVPPLALELVLDRLLLQAASTPSDSTAAAAVAVRFRQGTDLFMCSAFSWLSASHFLRNGCVLRVSGTHRVRLAKEDAVHWACSSTVLLCTA